MTLADEQKRVKIASLCGWQEVPDKFYLDRKAWLKDGQRHATIDLPDYLTDLNAIAQAEAILSDEEHRLFRQHLWEMTDANHDWCFEDTQNRSYISANARQRAEAFLSLKGRHDPVKTKQAQSS